VAFNGSEDLTLAKFCMTLDSALDVREYMLQYLVRALQQHCVRLRRRCPFTRCSSD
jgi:hypothetical protein